jgi:osmotically-inducible protein OsmY
MRFASNAIAALLVASTALPACAPLVVAGIVAGTAIVATDRRTTGTQVDDQTIQLRVADELSTALKGKGDVHISVNSFERRVLLTGEVPNGQIKAEAEAVAARSQNVRAVVNELALWSARQVNVAGEWSRDLAIALSIVAVGPAGVAIAVSSLRV